MDAACRRGGTFVDPALPCIACQQLLERLRPHVQGSNYVSVAQVTAVELPRCATECPRSRDHPRQFGEYAAVQIIRSVADTAHGLRFDGGDIHDLSYWRLHRGPVASTVAEVLRQADQPLNAEEICERIAAGGRPPARAFVSSRWPMGTRWYGTSSSRNGRGKQGQGQRA